MISAIILVLLMVSAVTHYNQAEGHEVKCVLVPSKEQRGLGRPPGWYKLPNTLPLKNKRKHKKRILDGTRSPTETWQKCTTHEDCNKVNCIFLIESFCSDKSRWCECPNAKIAKMWCTSSDDCTAYCDFKGGQRNMGCKDHSCICSFR